MSESVDALLREMRASRERLLSVVAGVSEEQFKRRPPAEAEATAGRWSIAETLAHLFGAEQRACVRVEALLAGEYAAPFLIGEEARDEEARQGRAVPVPQIIHGLLASRRRLERALAGAAPGDEAASTGGGTVAAEVAAAVREDVIEHELEHVAQIEAIKAVLPSRSAITGLQP